VDTLKRELQLKEQKLQDELHFRTLERIFIEERIYKKIEQCKTNEAVVAAVQNGFQPFRRQLLRELTEADVERLLAVRIRRISLFDINQHRREMEQVKGRPRRDAQEPEKPDPATSSAISKDCSKKYGRCIRA